MINNTRAYPKSKSSHVVIKIKMNIVITVIARIFLLYLFTLNPTNFLLPKRTEIKLMHCYMTRLRVLDKLIYISAILFSSLARDLIKSVIYFFKNNLSPIIPIGPKVTCTQMYQSLEYYFFLLRIDVYVQKIEMLLLP